MVRQISQTLLGSISKRIPLGLRIGVGDDAAVFSCTGGKEWVISSDFFLENVHFRLAPHSPESIGYKSLMRAASDLAAMGAEPRFFLFNLAMPLSRTGSWLRRFLRGMKQATSLLGMRLIGGDTTVNPSIAISITVLGEVRKGRAVLRSGAKPGHRIYVSGPLGRAELGLRLMLHGVESGPGLRSLLRPHLYPRPRIRLGAWLGRNRIASAMMDISDGLSTDLDRLCKASGVGAVVYLDKIPAVGIPGYVRHYAGFGRIDGKELALNGGDDYELLFAAPLKLASRIRGAPGAREITMIGEICSGKTIYIVDIKGHRRVLTARGWDPFARKRADDN